MLNPGNTIQIIAGEGEWRTDLHMNIAGQTFANSTVTRNIPGSEMFSSPVRGSAHGILALPYRLMFCGQVLPNLKLTFENGKVVSHYTSDEQGSNWVEAQLNSDPGAREVGEVALGTNPAITRPLLNPMLVEKVGGSAHIALGNAHQVKIYQGCLVNVDNGVRSSTHQDLTRVMLEQYGGGLVIVDEKVIQKNGFFVDRRLSILDPE